VSKRHKHVGFIGIRFRHASMYLNVTKNILFFFNVETTTVEPVTVSTGLTRKPGSTLNQGSSTKVTASTGTTLGSGGDSTGKIVKGSLFHFIVAEHKVWCHYFQQYFSNIVAVSFIATGVPGEYHRPTASH